MSCSTVACENERAGTPKNDEPHHHSHLSHSHSRSHSNNHSGAEQARALSLGVGPGWHLLTREELLFQRPATEAQLRLFAGAVERALSLNKKHLFVLQLAQHECGSPLSTVPRMDAPLVDHRGRLPAVLVTPYDGMAAPSYSFQTYLARIAKYTCAPPVYYLLAFTYMDRIACTPRRDFKQRSRAAMPGSYGACVVRGDDALAWWQDRVYLTTLNVHRMFLACFVVAAKYWSDRFYSSRVYGKIGGVRAEEMESLELATLIWLDFRLGINDTKYVPVPHPLPPEVRAARAGGEYLLEPERLLPALVWKSFLELLRAALEENVSFESYQHNLAQQQQQQQQNEADELSDEALDYETDSRTDTPPTTGSSVPPDSEQQQQQEEEAKQQGRRAPPTKWADVVNEDATFHTLMQLLSCPIDG